MAVQQIVSALEACYARDHSHLEKPVKCNVLRPLRRDLATAARAKGEKWVG